MEENDQFLQDDYIPLDKEEIDYLLPEDKSKKSLVRYDPLHAYLMEIRRYPLLTREEELALAIRYKETGDPEAAYRLITSNLRLVVKIALDFQRHWMMNLLDLIQEGNIGLMQAIKRFDPYKGVKLSSYASFWIKAYIMKFIIDNWRLIKIGTTQAQRKLFFNLKKEKERLDRMGFVPEPRLLAEKLDVKEGEVIEMDQRMDGWELSLDTPLDEESRYTHKDLLVAPAPTSDEILAREQSREILLEKIEEIRNTLNEKERDILDQRLLAEQPLTLQEIGDRYGISRERIRQIEERLKKKIKAFLEKEAPEIQFIDLE
jgi:RNA polymerase sigma-32 factor